MQVLKFENGNGEYRSSRVAKEGREKGAGDRGAFIVVVH